MGETRSQGGSQWTVRIQIPADLLAIKKARVVTRLEVFDDSLISATTIRKKERKGTMNKWQEAWSASTKEVWTKKLLPDIRWWCGRLNKFPASFYLAQALTGHGYFRHYLFTRKTFLTSNCVYCTAPSDAAEHTVFFCVHWEEKEDSFTGSWGKHQDQMTLKIICVDLRWTFSRNQVSKFHLKVEGGRWIAINLHWHDWQHYSGKEEVREKSAGDSGRKSAAPG